MSDTPETPAPVPTPTPTPEIADRQFSLLPDGSVTFQPVASNPLPGAPVATLRKGGTPLAPIPEIIDPAITVEGMDSAAFATRLSQWLEAHLRKVLEPLFTLENLVAAGGNAGAIAQGVIDGLGVARRADLSAAIAGLETDGRTALRQKKVRLGPAFIYLLEGNKPASVRLRGVLWALWNDRPLPPPLPHDGAVSAPCPDAAINPAFWTAIGYPLCGARVVRVDMHDRLVQSVYDAAEKGVFRAKHEMAEWLGCPIPDLYLVLESLGHRRIEDPVSSPRLLDSENQKEESKAEPPAEPALGSVPETAPVEAAPEGTAESFSAAPAPSSETPVSDPKPEEKPEQKKPELARFRLGPTPGSSGNRQASHDRRGPRLPRKAESQDGSASPSSGEDRKPFPRKDRDKDRPRHDNHNGDEGREGKRHAKGGKRGGRPDRDKDARGERPERVLRAEAKIDPEDSPFAILRNFKTSGS